MQVRDEGAASLAEYLYIRTTAVNCPPSMPHLGSAEYHRGSRPYLPSIPLAVSARRRDTNVPAGIWELNDAEAARQSELSQQQRVFLARDETRCTEHAVWGSFM
jgi:hypothetical protein